MSGSSTGILRSKRPGRKSALSRISGRFVAPRTIMPLPGSNPSISASSWLSVCSCSSLLAMPLESRFLPTASISSMKMMHGAFAAACLNKSRTRAAPAPTNISTNCEPLTKKNGQPASPATAFARRVLPVPGGPTSSAPLGTCAPMEVYLSGFFRISTISISDSFASS